VDCKSEHFASIPVITMVKVVLKFLIFFKLARNYNIITAFCLFFLNTKDLYTTIIHCITISSEKLVAGNAG